MRQLLLCLLLSSGLSLSWADEPPTPAFDARLSGYDYPFAVETFAFSSQGQQLEMAYAFLPGDSDKPVVTLMHGKNFNAAYWQQTAQALQQLGYSVLIPDQVGFGKSSKPLSYQYSFAALARNTRALMKQLDIDKSILLGHSMGGMLATRFALLYPQHSSQLILLNPIGLENYLQYVQYQDLHFFYRQERQLNAEAIRDYQRQNYYDGDWKKRYAALTEPLIGWVQGPDAEHMAQVNARSYDMIFTQPVVTEFAHLTLPTTLILGTRDRTGPGRHWKKPGVDYELGRYDQLGQRLQTQFPHLQLIELEDIGHLPHIEAFETFFAALQRVLPAPQAANDASGDL